MKKIKKIENVHIDFEYMEYLTEDIEFINCTLDNVYNEFNNCHFTNCKINYQGSSLISFTDCLLIKCIVDGCFNDLDLVLIDSYCYDTVFKNIILERYTSSNSDRGGNLFYNIYYNESYQDKRYIDSVEYEFYDINELNKLKDKLIENVDDNYKKYNDELDKDSFDWFEYNYCPDSFWYIKKDEKGIHSGSDEELNKIKIKIQNIFEYRKKYIDYKDIIQDLRDLKNKIEQD